MCAKTLTVESLEVVMAADEDLDVRKCRRRGNTRRGSCHQCGIPRAVWIGVRWNGV